MLYILILISLLTGTSAIASNANIIEQISSGYEQMKQNSCPENKKDGFYVFVSLSMPKSLLEQYDKLAKQIGAKLVMRGFKNNSFKETVAVTQRTLIQVDPVAFKKFNVTSVPSFVLSNNNQFDKLVGNVSIKYALEQFEQQGDLKQKAQEYLARLK
jgi:conjugal transfer pilus assembly protein TrbC